uniref:Uncharacterized protein n=1 Tax=Tetraodon nigroviridis TaxID=99883 RepID=H3CSG8_TETNG
HSTFVSALQVQVLITDENDCVPEFLQSIYSVDGVPETVTTATSLLQGLIRLRSNPLPKLQGLEYVLNVTATDDNASGGPQPLFSTARVIVGVDDVNNNKPVFKEVSDHSFKANGLGPQDLLAITQSLLFNKCQQYREQASVLENQPTGTFVLQVHAVDADEGANGKVKYGLMHRDSAMPAFRIHPDTGAIVTAQRFDRERQREYSVTVTATDWAEEPLIGICQLTVQILDQNDNSPKFENLRYEKSKKKKPLVLQLECTYIICIACRLPERGHFVSSAWQLMMMTSARMQLSLTPCPRSSLSTCRSTPSLDGSTSTSRYHSCQPHTHTLKDPPIPKAFEVPGKMSSLFSGLKLTLIIFLSFSLSQRCIINYNLCLHWSLEKSYACSQTGLSPGKPADAVVAQSRHAVSEELIAITANHLTSPSLCASATHLQPQKSAQRTYITRDIVATDGGNRSSSVELAVTITNVKNQPPQWEEENYSVVIPENTARDTPIVTIKATSQLGDPRVTYNLEDGMVPETNMPVRFYLSPNREDGSASILVSEPLDYETTSFFSLRVRAQNVAAVPLAAFTTVYVNITDVNDNVPFFTSSIYEASVTEGAQIGTSVLQVSAHDKDLGLNGQITYTLLSDSSGDHSLFRIDPELGIIYTEAVFDREARSSYLLERLYEVGVDEDADVGLAVVTVSATDEDEAGANAKLRYQITSGNKGGVFDIEPEVGTIFVAQPLDYEQQKRYKLLVLASDGRWEDYAAIVVTVVNKNDEAPVFSMNEYYGSVTEELDGSPVFVLQVTATDPDKDADQGAIRYSIHGQGAESHFVINDITGEMYAQRTMDREERTVWRFVVMATDEEGEGLTGFTDVIINVWDINDNAPTFTCAPDNCHSSIAENSPPGTLVVEMTAVDLDDAAIGQNAILTYRITKNVRNTNKEDFFAIDSSTGTISVAAEGLDREFADTHRVVVEASDGGGMTGTATVTIAVTDINDHAPKFLEDWCGAHVSENTDKDASVLELRAVDPDIGTYGQLTFSVLAGDLDQRFYMMSNRERQMGILMLKEKLDFEKPAEQGFNLTIKVEDSDFSSIIHCLIQIDDENDNAPEFASSSHLLPPLPEDVPVGTSIIQVVATDTDSGLNGEILYSILPQSDPHGHFAVSRAGLVAVARPLDRETVAGYELVVMATDGTPALTASVTVHLLLLDTNDNGPELETAYAPVMPLVNPHLEPWHKPANPTTKSQRYRKGGKCGTGEEKLHAVLAAHKRKLQSLLRVNVSQVEVDECVHADCRASGGCFTQLSVSNSPSLLDSGALSLVSVKVTPVAVCGCAAREMTYRICASYPGNPCLNGGTCMDTKNGYRMKPGTKTTGCCCAGPLATLLPGDTEDYMAIELIGGTPSLKMNHGSGTLVLQLNHNIGVANGRWHRLDVRSNSKEVHFTLDRCSSAVIMETEGVDSWVMTEDRSSCEIRGVTPKRDNGCIRNLLVDSKLYDLGSPAEASNTVPGCTLIDGHCTDGEPRPPCGLRGHCHSHWGSYSCLCQPGFTGPQCDRDWQAAPEFSFDGRSHIQFQLSGSLPARQTRVQVGVRTRAAAGVILSLLSQEQNEYLRLEVIQGLLAVFYNLGDGDYNLTLPHQHLSDGEWHELELDRYGREFTLRLDGGGGRREVTASRGQGQEIVVDPTTVMLGNSFPSGHNHSFLGSDVWGLTLPRAAKYPSGRRKPSEKEAHADSLASGCLSVFVHENVDAGQLKCPPGHITRETTQGKVCMYTLCASRPCRHGTCVAHSPSRYSCHCSEGYRGRHCEVTLAMFHNEDNNSLSLSSMFAISICVMAFLVLMLGLFLYSCWRRHKGLKEGVYHVSAHHGEWEDIRENVLNYDEEGGGEQDQVRPH